MIIIEDNVYKALKENLSSNSQFNPKVTKKAPREQAIFPIVIVRETENNYSSRTIDGLESISNLSYSVEIHTKDKEDATKEEIAIELERLVDRTMSRKFNMIRFSCQELPSLDTDILRIGMRYNATILDNRARIY